MVTENIPLRPVLLMRREACEHLKIGLSRYKLLVAEGRLREVAIGERGRRLPLSEVERFISERLAELSPIS
jgi:excisionase family DNA binding protein